MAALQQRKAEDQDGDDIDFASNPRCHKNTWRQVNKDRGEDLELFVVMKIENVLDRVGKPRAANNPRLPDPRRPDLIR